MVEDGAESIEEGIVTPESANVTQDEVAGTMTSVGPEADEKARVLQLQQDQELLGILNDLKIQYPAEVEAISAFLSNQNSFRQLQNDLAALPGLTEQYDMQAITPQVPSFDEYKTKSTNVLNSVRRLNAIRRGYERNQIPLAAFNLRRHKEAQIPMPQQAPASMPQQSPMPQAEGIGRFPVENEGDFISKFSDDLLVNNNRPGTQEYERARIAAEEIRDAVSPGFEEEANSILESVMQLDVAQRDMASNYLMKLYEVLLPPMLKSDQAESQMEPVMSEKKQDAIEGIVRFSLTDSVLNNKRNMTKTAADQFGQQYMLYGPSEKRICPKLRGKNLSVGDVVSEYTCRMHCIDGIVIDDNKTICGEALWRANAMDKYSREYVDENGDIVGGYINKRFEVNRNVQEENKMRLKPGETRKPRPAAWGNTESRLQDMRSKEGQARDYRPETNTGDPFEWCHDVDQNNVEVSQAERDRREEAAGHKLVQYTNRDQAENNPKKGFNLKQFKTAQAPVAYKPMDTHQTAINPTTPRAIGLGVSQPANIETSQGIDSGKPMIDPSGFQDLLFAIDDVRSPEDIQRLYERADSVIHIPKQWEIFHRNIQEKLGELGIRGDHTQFTRDSGKPMPANPMSLAGFNLKQHKEAKEKGVTYKGEHFDYNPWAVCNKSTGGKSKGEAKFERCVQHVKDQSRGEDKEDKKDKEAKVAECPQPHTTALPDHDYFRQNQPQDGHDPDVKPKKKT